MPKVYNEQDIRKIVYGAAFLAAGGGGGFYDGLSMVDDCARKRPDLKLTVVDPNEMKDGQNAVVICGIGAPTAVTGVKDVFQADASLAYDAMVELCKPSGVTLDAVLPVEYGAVNFIVAAIPCFEHNIPMVDADGCGRAVPGLDVTHFDFQKIPYYPAVAAGADGSIVTIKPKDIYDCVTAERINRYLCGAFGYAMGMGGWVSSKSDIINKLICGTVTQAYEVGNVIYEAKQNKSSIEDALKKVITTRKLCEGKIIKKENELINGHDIGLIHIQANDGKKYFVHVKNESMLFRDEEKAILTCPDMICCIDKDEYAPMTNADLHPGQNVEYYAVPAPAKWFETERAMNAFKPYFEATGYKGEVVRY